MTTIHWEVMRYRHCGSHRAVAAWFAGTAFRTDTVKFKLVKLDDIPTSLTTDYSIKGANPAKGAGHRPGGAEMQQIILGVRLDDARRNGARISWPPRPPK
jgi:hypothetical protein